MTKAAGSQGDQGIGVNSRRMPAQAPFQARPWPPKPSANSSCRASLAINSIPSCMLYIHRGCHESEIFSAKRPRDVDSRRKAVWQLRLR